MLGSLVARAGQGPEIRFATLSRHHSPSGVSPGVDGSELLMDRGWSGERTALSLLSRYGRDSAGNLFGFEKL